MYPPLPESRFGEESMYEGPSSPTRSRGPRSMAPSVSPSDSLSQVQTKRYQSTTKSPSRREGSNVNQSERGANEGNFSPRSSARQLPVNGNGMAPLRSIFFRSLNATLFRSCHVS